MIGARRASATETALATSSRATLAGAVGSATASHRPAGRPEAGHGVDDGTGADCRLRQVAAVKNIEAALTATRYVIQIVCTLCDPVVIAPYTGQVLTIGKQDRV